MTPIGTADETSAILSSADAPKPVLSEQFRFRGERRQQEPSNF
jgi:hypothetical protein